MKKEGRAVAVLVLLVFFIIAVAACGYYMIKLDKKEKEMQAIQEELSQIKEELKNKNIKDEDEQAKEEVSIDVDALNKEHCERILKIMGSGSAEMQYDVIMNREQTYENRQKYFDEDNKIIRENLTYIVTIDDYSEYEKEWKKFLSEEVMKNIIGYKGILNYSNMIINVNGKVAINDGSWSGGGKSLISQKQISKSEDTYVYEIKYKNYTGWDSTKYEEKTAIVTGKIEDSNYIIEKFENK